VDSTLVHRLEWTIWPAFLVAAAAETIFFTLFDPTDLYFFGSPLELSRQAMSTLGFFGSPPFLNRVRQRRQVRA